MSRWYRLMPGTDAGSGGAQGELGAGFGDGIEEVSEKVFEKPVYRGMGILPMSRRAILALPIPGFSTGETPVGHTGKDARATSKTPSERILRLFRFGRLHWPDEKRLLLDENVGKEASVL